MPACGVKGERVDEARGLGLLPPSEPLHLEEAHEEEEDGDLADDREVILLLTSQVPLLKTEREESRYS